MTRNLRFVDDVIRRSNIHPCFDFISKLLRIQLANAYCRSFHYFEYGG